eukprot:778863-Rhodomonas_salina.1
MQEHYMDGKASHSSGAPSLLICRVHHGNVSGRTQLLNAAYVLVKEHAVAKKKSGDAVRSYSKPAQTEASVSFTRLLIHHRSLLMTSTWCRRGSLPGTCPLCTLSSFAPCRFCGIFFERLGCMLKFGCDEGFAVLVALILLSLSQTPASSSLPSVQDLDM